MAASMRRARASGAPPTMRAALWESAVLLVEGRACVTKVRASSRPRAAQTTAMDAVTVMPALAETQMMRAVRGAVSAVPALRGPPARAASVTFRAKTPATDAATARPASKPSTSRPASVESRARRAKDARTASNAARASASRPHVRVAATAAATETHASMEMSPAIVARVVRPARAAARTSRAATLGASQTRWRFGTSPRWTAPWL